MVSDENCELKTTKKEKVLAMLAALSPSARISVLLAAKELKQARKGAEGDNCGANQPLK